MLSAIDFSFLGEVKKKKKEDEAPKKPPPPPVPPAKSAVAIPKWSPLAAGALGLGVVVLILVTSKGKD